MNTVSNTDLAYIAGLVDSEGWLGMCRGRKNAANNWSYYPMISIVNTCEKVLNWAAATTGVGFVTYMKQSLKNKDTWAWRSGNWADVEDLLTRLLPYMRIKKVQASTLLEVVAHRKSQKYFATDADRQLYFTNYQLLKKLNKRGRCAA